MKGKELQKLREQYPDFDFEFSFTDERNQSKWIDVRSFDRLELCDIGHSDKVVIITGEEK